MSLRDLQYALTVGLVDKLTGPAKNVAFGTQKLSRNLFETKNQLKTLNRQATQVASLQQLDKKMGRLATETGAAEKRLAGLWRQFNEAQRAGRATKRLQQSIGATQRKIESLRNAHDRLKTTSRETRTELRNAGVDVRNLGRAQRHLAEQIESSNSALGDQKSKLAMVNRISEGVSKTWGRIKRTAVGGGMAIVAAGGPMIATAMSFEQSMSTVGAVTRASDEQLARLTETARTLGRETSFSASEAADGMKYLGMAGFNTNQIIETMPGLLNLARAGGEELGNAANIASNVLSGFGLSADQTGRVSDVLAKTFTTSNTTLQMLGETMSYAAPVARQFGASIEEISAMAGLLGNVGLQGSRAGTTLNAMMLRLIGPSGEAAKRMEELGIKTRDADGNMRPILDIIDNINHATAQMGDGEKLALIKQIFGEEPAAGVAELLSQGSAGIGAYIDKMQRADGTAAAIAEKMGDNALGVGKQWQSAVESLSITVGNVFLPTLTKLIEKFTAVVRWVEGWAAENPLLIESLTFGAIAIGGLVAVVGALGFALPNIVSGFGLVTSAFKLFSAAAMANPIGITIAAIAGAAYLITEHWDEIVPWFEKTWAKLVAGFEQLPATFSAIGARIMEGLTGGIKTGITWVKTQIARLGDLLPEWLKKRLDIRSPSRVFATIGGQITEGVGVGITHKTPRAVGAMQGLAKRLARPLPAIVAGGVIAAGAAAPAGAMTVNITINASAEQSAADIGREVARQIDALQRRQAARARAQYIDSE